LVAELRRLSRAKPARLKQLYRHGLLGQCGKLPAGYLQGIGQGVWYGQSEVHVCILAITLLAREPELMRNARYVLRSCSRSILKGCSQIATLKIGQNSRFEAFQSLWQLESVPKTENLFDSAAFLRHLSSRIPINYCGSSY
jgi:hypothetical protein